MAAVVAGGVAQEGYSHVQDALSGLGASGSAVSWVQNATLVALGAAALVLALVPGAGPVLGTTARVALGVGALGLVGTGVVPCSAGCPIPGGRAETTRDAVHLVFGVVVVGASVVAALAAARRGRRGAPPAYARLSLVTGVAVVALAALHVAVAEPGGMGGLSQRLMVAPALVWLAVTAVVVGAAGTAQASR